MFTIYEINSRSFNPCLEQSNDTYHEKKQSQRLSVLTIGQSAISESFC